MDGLASKTTKTSTPYYGRDGATYLSPKVGGINGDQQSLWTSPTPSFPLAIQTEEIRVLSTIATPEHGEPPSSHHLSTYQSFHQHRPLTTFEEESETDSISDLGTRGVSASPVHSNNSPRSHSPHSRSSMTSSPIRSRRLINARSSPSIMGLITKSDGSEEEEDEEDDDIVELMTTSGRFPKGNTLPRMSPSNSPLLTSRKSPTPWAVSSDEEVSNIYEASQRRRLRHKRGSMHRRSLRRPRRVNSVSSDDGTASTTNPVERCKVRRENLLRMRHVHSLPTTPADMVSESLTELLDNIRRQRSNSQRTDSSLSDCDTGRGGGEEEEEEEGEGDTVVVVVAVVVAEEALKRNSMNWQLPWSKNLTLAMKKWRDRPARKTRTVDVRSKA